MALPKGKSGNPNGRPKGVPNKVTQDLKEMVMGALNQAGGQNYLVQQAVDNPGAFMGLVGKCFPKEVKADIQGAVNLIVSTGIPRRD